MTAKMKLLQEYCKAKVHSNEPRRLSIVYKQGGICHSNIPIGQRKSKRDMKEGRMIWEQDGRRRI